VVNAKDTQAVFSRFLDRNSLDAVERNLLPQQEVNHSCFARRCTEESWQLRYVNNYVLIMHLLHIVTDNALVLTVREGSVEMRQKCTLVLCHVIFVFG
jgi:hypothetical protein